MLHIAYIYKFSKYILEHLAMPNNSNRSSYIYMILPICIDSTYSYRIICQEMRMLKLVTEAMVKPVGYDVHSVHTPVIINLNW